MKTFIKLFLCIYFFYSPDILGQLVITYPSNRAVFQRDNNNEAMIHIGGYLTSPADVIEARFVRRINGSPETIATETGWETLTTTTSYNNFYGSMKVMGGWYQLEVRSKKNGSINSSSRIERVGVGEVFIVAGQSNATGSNELPGGPAATDDRVNSVNFQNYNPDGNIILPYHDIHPPYPVYTHLEANTKLAPFGNNAWCWGKFGDYLVNELNVPVMIFNSGWTATSSKNWQETIDINVQSVNGFGYHFPTGLPFGHLRIALNYYASILGVRAVLWHQGESDNLESRSREDYRNNMRSIIEASRNLSGKPNLAWMVARASRYHVDGISRIWDPVIQAQNDVIGINGNNPGISLPHVFAGPETDSYWQPPYRHDEVHFSGTGLDFLGEQWKNHTNAQFFTQSQPYPASPPHSIQIAANHIDGKFNLTAPTGQAAYRWTEISNFSNTLSGNQTYSIDAGSLLVETRDMNNNVIFSPEFRLLESSLPVQLTHFSGIPDEYSNKLIWATATEQQASHFEVERSINITNFEVIGHVNSQIESSQVVPYEFIDKEIAGETYYYRLKMIDLDNSFEYSPVIAVHNKNLTGISVYPNPVVNELTIHSKIKATTAEVFTVTGTRIYEWKIQDGETTIDFSRFPSGLYLVKVNGKTFKILKH